MSEQDLAVDLTSLTDQDIIDLLEREDLPEDLHALITEYQQALYSTTTDPLPEPELPYPIGDKCVFTFSIENSAILLPAIVLSYHEDNTTMRVMVLTPLTLDTVPCTDYFGSQKKCKDYATPCPQNQSHGYTIPVEFVAAFEALEMDDSDKLIEQLQYGKPVLCREKDQTLWQRGHIIDQLHGPRWRVRLDNTTKRNIQVDIDHIMPLKDLLQENQLEDQREEYNELDKDNEDEEEIIIETPSNEFGGWQIHTTGFAARMMAKMGYVEGSGLGVHGHGRINPIEAKPYLDKKHKGYGADNSRPGLGMQQKPKKLAQNKKGKAQELDMFGWMDNLLSQPQESEETIPKSVKSFASSDTRQTNQNISKLRSSADRARAEYIHANEAYRRNKGSPVEDHFIKRLKETTHKYENLKKQLAELETHVKRTKEKKDMYTF
ncbi:hypothetical protein EDC96DRAFT_143031 [Choanephora cucurbitarum]|nr:hypothetical protein EDC96DRAFT_143031 [Choanephora cucurbitarum]